MFRSILAGATVSLALTFALPATADTFAVFSINGTYDDLSSGSPVPQTFYGTLTVDETLGVFSGGQVSTSSLGQSTNLVGQGPNFPGVYYAALRANSYLNFYFSQTPDGLITNFGGLIVAGYGADTISLQTIANNFSGTISETPLPAALPLFASGLGTLGLLGWRRKRKNSPAVAA